MALKLGLKPNEKVFIGGAVIQNGSDQVELSILNDVPLLRGRDIIAEQDADTACKQIYLCVQLMYMDRSNLAVYQRNYRQMIESLIVAMPGSVEYIAEINNDLACGKYYQALKCAGRLVDFEQEHTKNAQ